MSLKSMLQNHDHTGDFDTSGIYEHLMGKMDEFGQMVNQYNLHICNCNIAYTGDVNNHLLLHHQVKWHVYECPLCEHETITPQGLQAHLNHKHNTRATETGLYHKNTPAPYVSLLICPYCDYTKTHATQIAQHLNKEHALLEERRANAIMNLNDHRTQPEPDLRQLICSNPSSLLFPDSPAEPTQPANPNIIQVYASSEENSRVNPIPVNESSNLGLAPAPNSVNVSQENLYEANMSRAEEHLIGEDVENNLSLPTSHPPVSVAASQPNYASDSDNEIELSRTAEHLNIVGEPLGVADIYDIIELSDDDDSLPELLDHLPEIALAGIYDNEDTGSNLENVEPTGDLALELYSTTEKVNALYLPTNVETEALHYIGGQLIDETNQDGCIRHTVRFSRELHIGRYLIKNIHDHVIQALAVVDRGELIFSFPEQLRAEVHSFRQWKDYEFDFRLDRELAPGLYVIEEDSASVNRAYLIVDWGWKRQPQQQWIPMSPPLNI